MRQNLPVCKVCERRRRPWLISKCSYHKGLVCDGCCDKCFEKHGDKCLSGQRIQLPFEPKPEHFELLRKLVEEQKRKEGVRKVKSHVEIIEYYE